MPSAPLYIGRSPYTDHSQAVTGKFVTRNGESYYRIGNYNSMRAFFMSIVSSSDHWLFISSNGALTAGRRNPQHALFPYYTDDKIHDSAELTGSKTILLVEKEGKQYLWEPFSDRYQGAYRLQRNLYKHIFGTQLIFEEKNEDLGVVFSYAWQTSNRFGFVKTAWIRNEGKTSVGIHLLDGIQNLLPYGVNLAMQTELSTLVDAYKKNELQIESGLGIFMLSSILVDRPEPSEALKATTVWSEGLEVQQYLLSSRQLDNFRRGKKIEQEVDVRAERGAYFLEAAFELAANEEKNWRIVAEIDQGPSEVAALSQMLLQEENVSELLQKDIHAGTHALEQIVASADGLQVSADRLSTTRHFANVLFNVMRGGIYARQYVIEREDLVSFIQSWNRPLADAKTDFFHNLPASLPIQSLLQLAKAEKDQELLRLCYEYLPLTFSRRHGDPSRPWNFFSIDTQREDGSEILSYQGNWRDIFQNWEALSVSYPEFIESIICKFVNASTADGYNPYRITRDGIDWEVHDPSDPWAFIGYWGDHQLIYLLKLLELSHAHHPGQLQTFLEQEIFAYANVPYRIKPFEQILADPHNTIEYDYDLEAILKEREAAIGADGKLIWDRYDLVYKVTLSEKLLVTILTKLSNFVPGAGIWMNTQRPEWNDANNALVGYGISTVTLCYLRRFLLFCQDLFDEMRLESVHLSVEVYEFMQKISSSLDTHLPLLDQQLLTDEGRFQILEGLGQAGSIYRQRIYQQGFQGKKVAAETEEIQELFELALRHIDHSLYTNKRPDHLYHSYQLIEKAGESSMGIRPLYEMLEGQVAILSSAFLSAQESVQLLQSMKQSALYRKDQYSYLLYPDRQLARFTEKNQIPSDRVEQSPFLQKLLQANNRSLIEQDVAGNYHFNGSFRNAESVTEALRALAEEGYADAVASEGEQILEIFEEMFDHQSFTGRSGTFYGYEGLGCIYWHMVSKLLLAVCETYYRAYEAGESKEVLNQLVEAYYDIRAGIGLNKSPDVYGAFPTDPYSHTPGNAGAQQPGMTGQVKEDILSRFGELGVVVRKGSIQFQPILLRKSELISTPSQFSYYPIQEERQQLGIPSASLAFTYCQIPVCYHLAEVDEIRISFQDGRTDRIEGLALSPEISKHIFGRTGEIQQIEVFLTPGID